jgi:acetolactate synthase-1/2/3 large subunit
MVEEADVLLVVGSDLGQGDHWSTLEPRGHVVRIDVDPAQAHGNVAATLALVGDAGAVLGALERALPNEPAAEDGWIGRRAQLDAEAEALGRSWATVAKALEAALEPGDVLAADNAMVAYNGVVGSTRLGAGSRLLFPTGFGTLGYALPAAIGAKLARPDRRVAAVMGDGGLMFTVQELATAAQLGLPLPLVVSVNGGYGEIRREMVEQGFAPLGVELGTPDLPAVARALGGAGVALEDAQELPAALETAFAHPGPTLIAVPE